MKCDDVRREGGEGGRQVIWAGNIGESNYLKERGRDGRR